MNALRQCRDFTATASALCCLLAAATASADYVVLESSSEDFQPGHIVAQLEDLQGRDGLEMLLLSEQGETLRIGAESDAGEQATSSEELTLMLTNLVQSKRDEHISLGGTRGGGGKGGNAPAFDLDPFISGIQCLVKEIKVRAYRSDNRGELELKVLKAGSRESGKIKWKPGSHEAQWPEAVPIEDGARYTIKREGYMESNVVQLESIPEISMDDSTTAIAWMAAKKCIPQAVKLLEMLETGVIKPPSP